MLQNIKSYYGKRLGASDGDIGQVKDFYFDDKSWAVRYVVVDTETWLTGRMVLLAPHSFGGFDPYAGVLLVNLTRKQIEKSPLMESHLPVSRQYEEEYYHYYGLPAYWEGGQIWGMGGYPIMAPSPHDEPVSHGVPPSRADRHLRSALAVTGYHIQTRDGTIGQVSGLMMNEKSWGIQELVIETGHWYAGKEVTVPIHTIQRISYEDSRVLVNLTEEEIKQSPELQNKAVTN